jgi:glycosyltransferase involved in cell wall biosynthesis
MTERLLVFIPCYNCEKQIPRVLRQFTPEIAARFEEILVLDNGSKDGTLQAAADAIRALPGIRAKVAKNRDNYNLGGSHKAAFAYAAAQGYSHVVVLHGDDQGNIADLLPVLDAGLHRQFDACLGSRFMKGSRVLGYSAFRIVGNVVFNSLFSFGSSAKVLDMGSGLNIFGERVFRDPKVNRHSDDLRFNNYLLLSMIDDGLALHFFPISWREDDQVSNVKMASQAFRTLDILREYLLDRWRFRTADHRDRPRDAYVFDVIAQTDEGPVDVAAARPQ